MVQLLPVQAGHGDRRLVQRPTGWSTPDQVARADLGREAWQTEPGQTQG